MTNFKTRHPWQWSLYAEHARLASLQEKQYISSRYNSHIFAICTRIIQWFISIHTDVWHYTTQHPIKVGMSCFKKRTRKASWSFCHHWKRQTARLTNFSQYFLVKRQIESLLVIGNHKFKVIIVTSNKYILSGSWSTMAHYNMNYLGCAEHFLPTVPEGDT